MGAPTHGRSIKHAKWIERRKVSRLFCCQASSAPSMLSLRLATANLKSEQIAKVVPYFSRHLRRLNRKVHTAIEMYKSPWRSGTLQSGLNHPYPAWAGRTMVAPCSRDFHVKSILFYHGMSRIVPTTHPQTSIHTWHIFTSSIFIYSPIFHHAAPSRTRNRSLVTFNCKRTVPSSRKKIKK